MTRPFSEAFKRKMVLRMTGREAKSANQLARETGLRQQTLSHWLQQARTLPIVPPKKKQPKIWSVAEKARIVSEAAALDADELGALLEREGLQPAQLEQWRLALEDEGRHPKAVTNRIRRLERELARKEKALAEAAALLVLKKKAEELWADDEDDDTDEPSET